MPNAICYHDVKFLINTPVMDTTFKTLRTVAFSRFIFYTHFIFYHFYILVYIYKIYAILWLKYPWPVSIPNISPQRVAVLFR